MPKNYFDYLYLWSLKLEDWSSFVIRTLDTQREVFFVLGQTNCVENLGAFVVFSANISAPILGRWVPCPCFQLFLQKIDLFFQILNIYLGLGFELGPQINCGGTNMISFNGRYIFSVQIRLIFRLHITKKNIKYVDSS